MAEGRVKWFNDAKGYGFIQSDSESCAGKDVFVHFSDIVKEGYRTLSLGQPVEFELMETARGLAAKNVVIVSP